MDDLRAMQAAIEAEERRLANRLEAEDRPPGIGPARLDEARLLSVIAEVALDVEPDVADEIALRVLEHWDYEVARRAVELYAQRKPMPVSYEDVAAMATVIVESDRLATLRRRAKAGDRAAAQELVQIKRAMRLASEGPTADDDG